MYKEQQKRPALMVGPLPKFLQTLFVLLFVLDTDDAREIKQNRIAPIADQESVGAL